MIRPRYNRFVAYAAMINFLGGFLVLLEVGVSPMLALFLPWSISAVVVLLTRCPVCGVVYGRNKSGFIGPIMPKRCWDCGYEYK